MMLPVQNAAIRLNVYFPALLRFPKVRMENPRLLPEAVPVPAVPLQAAAVAIRNFRNTF